MVPINKSCIDLLQKSTDREIIGVMESITTLSEFIASLGDAVFADRYGTKERTAASWRRGERFPRPEQARTLIENSLGELTMDMIYRAPPKKISKALAGGAKACLASTQTKEA
jgi:hypothetical protein